jgi:nuclear transport factor 2 (NTF2) superfamily protein
VKAAEDAWNSRDPERVALAYTEDSEWRNRTEFFCGRDAIRAILRRKWEQERDYRLLKDLWAFTGNRISVRFEYEWHDAAGQRFRTHGNSSPIPGHRLGSAQERLLLDPASRFEERPQ